MQLSDSWIYIIVHCCNSNSTTQTQQGTMDMVPLKVDESVLMDDLQNEFVFLFVVYNRRKCKFVLHIGWYLSFDKKLVYIDCSTSQ